MGRDLHKTNKIRTQQNQLKLKQHLIQLLIALIYIKERLSKEEHLHRNISAI